MISVFGISSGQVMMAVLVLRMIYSGMTTITVSACSCIPERFCEKTSSEDILFRGIPTAMELIGEPEFPDIKYTVQINNVFKGDVVGPTIEVFTAADSALCGITMELNTRYLIGMNNNNGAALCGPTKPWNGLSKAEKILVKNGGECPSE